MGVKEKEHFSHLIWFYKHDPGDSGVTGGDWEPGAVFPWPRSPGLFWSTNVDPWRLFIGRVIRRRAVCRFSILWPVKFGVLIKFIGPNFTRGCTALSDPATCPGTVPLRSLKMCFCPGVRIWWPMSESRTSNVGNFGDESQGLAYMRPTIETGFSFFFGSASSESDSWRRWVSKQPRRMLFDARVVTWCITQIYSVTIRYIDILRFRCNRQQVTGNIQ